mmetsp:Transcript_38897/g.67314  ORF Transcript_38897/g.67314 Transcript_38897/m.67314 type:complete len:289 (+) Transcript_38897:326-1192(+)
MQGDPAGPFLFCLGLKACLQSIESQLPPSAVLLSLMDDIIILLDSDDAIEAFRLYQAELKAKFNLDLNVIKCKLLPFGDSANGPQFPNASLDEEGVLRLEGLEVARNGAKLLGCPMGTDASKQAFFQNKLAEIQGLLDKIGKLDTAQIQLLLLCFCAHPCVTYWNRLIDPRTPGKQDFLRQHDAQIVRAVQSVVHVQPGEFLPQTTTQLSLPANLGGAGLSNQERFSGIADASSVAMSSGAIFQRRLGHRRFVGWRTDPQQFRELAVISNACEYWSSAVNEVCTLDPY